MAIVNIRTIKDEISGLFDTLLTDNRVVANFDYAPLADEIQGRSPLHSLHYDGSDVNFAGNSRTVSRHRWISTIYVNRQGHGNITGEDTLLSLVMAVNQILRDAPSGSSYAAVEPTGQSRPAFVEIGGIPYRVCETFIMSLTYDN